MPLWMTKDPEANALLDRDPTALLIGMLLDQQIPMEVAFAGPHKIITRIGTLDARTIADFNPETFATLCTTPPAIHRFGGVMARRVQELARHLVAEYEGDTAAIWTRGEPDGAEILKRLKALPGFGEQKAKIFLALLGKQRGLTAPGWREAAGAYGEEGSHRSVADVVDDESLQAVRSFKKAAKAAARQS